MSQDLTAAMAALAALDVHPVGVTVDGPMIALQLSPSDQAAVLADSARRDRIVDVCRRHGFLYVTLALETIAETPRR